MPRTVIVGAGIAGGQTALELRQHGYDGDVVLVGEELELPYDRPPLSKEFLKTDAVRDSLHLLPAQTAADRDITTLLGRRVTDLAVSQQQIVLSDGTTLDYDHLVLATGAYNRQLPVPGAELPGVWSLRRVDEAEGLRLALRQATRVVVIGGGFIGLEVAAAAQARGAHVTVVEFLPRVMARVLSPEMSQFFADEHHDHGVTILTGVGVTAVLEGPEGTAAGVTLGDGSFVPADVVVVGIGVSPATELAERAGIRTGDGVVVDEYLRTSDRRIFAIGDCARFDCVMSGQNLRLESIQNAADQARFVAAQIASPQGDDALSGRTDASPIYSALPWFWTEQYDSKLQIAGVATPDANSIVRGDPATGSFSVCRFDDGRLVAVESVNHARDHLGARKILAAEARLTSRVTPDSVSDVSTPLKSLIDLPSPATAL